MVIFFTHYSTMEHLTTDNYLKSINRLFQRTANTRCSLKHLNFKYNCTFCFIHTFDFSLFHFHEIYVNVFVNTHACNST